ncbi:MAG: T9SS C-terminal target domain-containing protein [Calditrichaeota bacterium]|nr:MAG: T9SS C-terminal target domain-containing protein [Calditrichota bacterium]
MKNRYLQLLIIAGSFFFLLLLNTPSAAQNRYFEESEKIFAAAGVAEIRIQIRPDYLAYILAEENEDSDSLFTATMLFKNNEITGDTLENVGFRLRGNTSRGSHKRSFKVDINEFVKGRDFYGLEKLNINGEHNDPSILRSMISWKLFELAEIPASRSTYAALFINNNYYGLYVLVEHIDDEFVKARFDGPMGNLYKCLWPADLTIPDQNNYKEVSGGRRTYDLKTNKAADDYSDLKNFIEFINYADDRTFAQRIEEVFNVPMFMRFLALNTLVGMWDDYWFNKNNFYVYHNLRSDKFEFIPYDYDNTYGIDWFNIDWAARNIYEFGNEREPRPLVTRLLAIPAYKNLYSHSIDEFINGIFRKADQAIYLESWHTEARLFVQIDPFYSLPPYNFTYNGDWENALTAASGRHVKYGIYDYIDRRIATARSQLRTGPLPLQILDLTVSNEFPVIGEQVKISCTVTSNDAIDDVECVYQINEGVRQVLNLARDADQSQAGAGEVIWSAQLPALQKNESMRFFLRAKGTAGAWSLFPKDAPGDPVQLFATDEDITYPIVINEFMAANDSALVDEAGEFDDWLELYNPADSSVNLSGMFLSDNPENHTKWMLPDTSIEAGGFLLIWADEDGSQGPLHANFKISRNGEFLGLYAPTTEGNFVIDSLSFGPLWANVSLGRVADGGDKWDFFESSTPGFSNATTGVFENQNASFTADIFQITAPFPNPAKEKFRVGIHVKTGEKVRLTVHDIRGRMISDKTVFSKKNAEQFVEFDCTQWAVGLYFIVAVTNGERVVKKITRLR